MGEDRCSVKVERVNLDIEEELDAEDFGSGLKIEGSGQGKLREVGVSLIEEEWAPETELRVEDRL